MRKVNVTRYLTLAGDKSLQFLSVLSIATIFVIASCSDDSSESVSGQPACRVTKITTNVSARESEKVTYTAKSVFTFSYDAAGNIIENTTDYAYIYSTGSKPKSQSTVSNQFDDQGFLLRVIRRGSQTDQDGKESNSTSDTEHKYENGRLIKSIVSNTDNGKSYTYTVQYEYDNAGRLVKYGSTYNNSTIAYEYNGNTITKITQTNEVGATTSPFIQYDQKNRIIKTIETYGGGYTDEFRYEYNDDDAVTREERYIDGKRNSATTYEFDNRENTSQYTYALTKGVPRVPYTRPPFGNKHNYVRYTQFKPDAAGTAWQPNGSTVYTYDYNSNNFPTASTSKSINADGVEISSTSTAYEYAGCQ